MSKNKKKMMLFPNGRTCWYCCNLIGVRGNGGMKEHLEYCEWKNRQKGIIDHIYDLYYCIKFTILALSDREERVRVN